MQENLTSYTVLMIEDDPAGIELALCASAACNVDFSLVLLKDADAVLTWLNDCDTSELTFPRVILIDLKLPKLEGLAVVRKLRLHAATSDVPVLAFSSEYSQADIVMSYQVGANSFVEKPVDLQHFIRFFNKQIPYWLQPRQRKLAFVSG